MIDSLRRVVTGNGPDGRSSVVADVAGDRRAVVALVLDLSQRRLQPGDAGLEAPHDVPVVRGGTGRLG